MQYVFEDGTKGKGEILSTFDRVSEEQPIKERFGLIPGGYSFVPKTVDVPQLQPADILAWESGWHMKNSVANSKIPEPPKRLSFRELCKSPLRNSFFHEGNILRLIEKTRQTDTERAKLSLGVTPLY